MKRTYTFIVSIFKNFEKFIETSQNFMGNVVCKLELKLANEL